MFLTSYVLVPQSSMGGPLGDYRNRDIKCLALADGSAPGGFWGYEISHTVMGKINHKPQRLFG